MRVHHGCSNAPRQSLTQCGISRHVAGGGALAGSARTTWLESEEQMPFSYYARLSARDKAIYRRSDALTSLALPSAAQLQPTVAALREALERDDRRGVEAAAGRLAGGIVGALSVPPVAVAVLAVRPSSSWGELHGLYTRDGRRLARIQLWMRTARQERVVAFRTFLRTLLHEVGHHLDYEYLRLEESFHTEGFFRRESSLFKQLVPEAAGRLPPGRRPRQLSLESRPGRK
jgi:hypothetical protein